MIEAARRALTLFPETTARSIVRVQICRRLERMENEGHTRSRKEGRK